MLQSVANLSAFAYFFAKHHPNPTTQLHHSMKKKLLLNSREELVELVVELSEKVKKRNEDLTLARHRLNKAKQQIKRLEGIVSYQRGRILELHS
jgi:hypothetical protein